MKIVIIDDSSINLMLIKAYLNRLENTKLFTFTNPRQALAWCVTNDPDMILDYKIEPEQAKRLEQVLGAIFDLDKYQYFATCAAER